MPGFNYYGMGVTPTRSSNNNYVIIMYMPWDVLLRIIIDQEHFRLYSNTHGCLSGIHQLAVTVTNQL